MGDGSIFSKNVLAKNRTVPQPFDVIVIGAGPAGMLCAGRAAERGKKVLLLEKNAGAGKKLLIAGKGRCNLTNAGDIHAFLNEFSASGIFLRNAFSRFFNRELCGLIEKYGVALKQERGGRIFPESDKSSDILAALTKYLTEHGVTTFYNAEVTGVHKKSDGNFEVSAGKDVFRAAVAVIATGGLSYPETGCDGFGYALARQFGHHVIAPRPGLVGLVVKEKLARDLAGLSLENVSVSVLMKGKPQVTRFGDMLFTHFGVSGPIILDISGRVYDLLAAGKEVMLSINLKPALSREKIDSRLLREFQKAPNKALKNIFTELLPRRLIDGFLRYCGVSADIKANQTAKELRRKLVDGLVDFRLTVTKARPIEEAIVTRGGVNTKEINPKTMESRLVSGLYFCGEVIDVDAQTGGFNLQAAFSTGYVCGDTI